MLNKNSCFTSGSLTIDNYLKIKQILYKMSTIDKNYLEILHYTIEEKEVEKKEMIGFAFLSEIKRIMTGKPKG